jgi:hypothetical protein
MTSVQRKQFGISRSLSLAASAVLGLTVLGAGARYAMSDPQPPTTPTQQQDSQQQDSQRAPASQSISGEVQGYNLDPRGNVSSIVLKDGDHFDQLNLPPDAGAAVSAAAPVGQTVQATGFAEVNAGDRVIYRLLSLTGANGQKITLPSRESRQTLHVEGSVKQLNYGRRGEVDGVILDTGDFVHLDPRSAATLNLAVGQKVVADGTGQPMLSGHNVIEASNVNGTAISHPEHRMGEHQDGPRGFGGFDGDHGPHGPGGPDGQGPDGDGPPPGQ